MRAGQMSYGIPDVELELPDGRTINPSCFAGHDVVILFCPASSAETARELAAYHARSEDFSADEAWIVAVAGGTNASHKDIAASSPIVMAFDRDGAGWRAFKDLLLPHNRTRADDGAAFLFRRGGNLQHAWSGTGHADEVARELSERR